MNNIALIIFIKTSLNICAINAYKFQNSIEFPIIYIVKNYKILIYLYRKIEEIKEIILNTPLIIPISTYI